ncbi:MAG: hypothetical protein ACRDYE_12895 [Acidimicrobiales bacterium]
MVDLSTGSVSLGEPDDLERLSVLVLPTEPEDRGDAAALGAVAAALSVHDAGTVDPDGNVFIPIEAVKRLVQGAARDQGLPDAGWEPRFTAMVEQASTRGWVTDAGTIRAHIDWDRS